MKYFPAIMDSSMLASFKSCPTLFNKQYILNWKAKEVSVHLHAGASFAKGLEATRRAFYEDGLSSEDAIATGVAALLRAYGDFQTPADSAKSAERMAGAFEFYFTNYGLNHEDAYPILQPGGKRAIEFSFAHPLPLNNPATGEPIIYCGRMDAVINYGGNIFICDEKTTTSLGPTWSRQWDLRAQFMGYSWGCGESRIKVDGALVRGVSILKHGYQTQQAPIKFADWQIARWYDEMLGWVEEIIKCWKTDRWRHAFDHACSDFGGCSFRTACISLDETPWLETFYERRIWNPLLRTETKVE